MRVGAHALSALLTRNAVELKFRRRRLKPGWSNTRRMLCTNDLKLLNSPPGHIALNYKPPTHPLPYAPGPKNLVLTWDLFWQAHRMINCDNVDVISVIPTDPPDQFWSYFSESLVNLSSAQKVGFMNA